jgi:hypothetical protein
MTDKEWASSRSAKNMLSMLHQEQPQYLATQVRQLHKFLIACCWKHQHLIPQDSLRSGLKGAEKWIRGEIDEAELNRLEYYAEADAFFLDYATTPEEITEIKTLIEGIEEVREMPFDQARSLLRDAAYFADGSIMYPLFDRLPWVESLFASEFLCPDLLREFLEPKF